MGIWNLIYGSTNRWVLTLDAATTPAIIILHWRIIQ
jgi:hypothetical protein